MSTPKDGGSVFPLAAQASSGIDIPASCGMTLRDYFAAAALNGSIAAIASGAVTPENACMDNWKLADLMLKARER